MSFGADIASGYADELMRRIALLVVASALVGAVMCYFWSWSPYSLKQRCDELEKRVEALEAKEGE